MVPVALEPHALNREHDRVTQTSAVPLGKRYDLAGLLARERIG